jgi:hypothetical protein
MDMLRRFRPSLSATGIAAVMCLHTSVTASAQSPTGSIVGTVINAKSGNPLPYAIINVGARHVGTDSLGRFSFDALPTGETHVRFRGIGFPSLDTVVVVTRSGSTRLDVRIQVEDYEAERRAAAAIDMAAGRTDSSALGLLKRTPLDSPLTFNAFGGRFARAIAGPRGTDSNTVLSPTSAALALSMPLLGERRNGS